MAELDPVVRHGGEEIRFEVDRVTIEPYDLQQPVGYDVLLDRVTHWYHTSREWIKKAIVMDGLPRIGVYAPWSGTKNEGWLRFVLDSNEIPNVRVRNEALGGAFVPRRMMNLSCSFDHRVVDGWVAAEFVQKLKSLLEAPAMMFMELGND